MNIGVDVRPLVYAGTGNANFLFYLLKEVIANSPKGWKWKLFSHKSIHKEYQEILKEDTELLIHGYFISTIGPFWLHFYLPKILKKHKIDVFWSTLFLLPYNFKKRIQIPCLLNIHDVNAWMFPKTMKYWENIYLKLFTKNSLKNADMILCLSYTTQNLLLKYFKDIENLEKKLKVIYPGIIEPHKTKKPFYFPISSGSHFYLAVGTIEPRKNFETLIKAYIEAQKEYNYLPSLIIAGKPGWKMTPLLEKLCKNELKNHNIYFFQSPKIEELYWLYENCSVFFYPSIYEGFGLQILEAAYFKKVQVLSNIEIFKEIGMYLEGIFFVENPLDILQWKEKILFFSDKKNISKHTKKIKKEPAAFSYKESAMKMIELLMRYQK